MKKAILLLMCTFIIGCQGKGDIVGAVNINNFKVVRIIELNDRIFLFGNISLKKEPMDYEISKTRSVICELRNGQVEEIDQSEGMLVDAQLIDGTIYLAKNLGTGVVEIEIVSFTGNNERIGSLKGRCIKFKKNLDGNFIFIFEDNIKITDNSLSVEYEEKFKYISGFYDEIYFLKNSNFIFVSDRTIYEYRFVDKNLLRYRPDIVANIYVDRELDDLYKIIKIDKTKSEIQIWRRGVFIKKFEVDLMLIDRVYKFDYLIFGGSSPTFGSKLCTYSLDGEKIKCSSPRLGDDWPYFITENKEMISYSSKMIQRIKLSDL